MDQHLANQIIPWIQSLVSSSCNTKELICEDMEIDDFLLEIHNANENCSKSDFLLNFDPPPNINELVLDIDRCRAKRKIHLQQVKWIKECKLKRDRTRYKHEINNHMEKRPQVNMINKERFQEEPHEHNIENKQDLIEDLYEEDFEFVKTFSGESEENLDDLERDSHHKYPIIQEDDEVSTLTWPF